MVTGDLQERLAAIPGVLNCRVTDETVALLVHPEVDCRLLKARAQVACAELGDRRPLLVAGGLPSAPAAGVAGSLGSRSRRATPLAMAVASLFVLSAVALVPIETGGSRAPGQHAAPQAVALAPSPSRAPSPVVRVPATAAIPTRATPVVPGLLPVLGARRPRFRIPLLGSLLPDTGVFAVLPPDSVVPPPDLGVPVPVPVSAPGVPAPAVGPATAGARPQATTSPPPPALATSEPATGRTAAPLVLASGASAPTTTSDTAAHRPVSRQTVAGDDPAPASPAGEGAAKFSSERGAKSDRKPDKPDKPDKAEQANRAAKADNAVGHPEDSVSLGRTR